MNWSESTWKQTEQRYQAILTMPFVSQLADGSLPKEKFQFYMAQDSLYLGAFRKSIGADCSQST
ncbi:hypothetical protein [Chryseobacterium indoltheticum]|uniref:hypothetical protein n=1 Tax=Chryseobacterium indoltheticum TaxID=254 RepID=UPI003F497C05